MRFPLSMTAGMAGYIAKNKMMPRPEWQVNVKASNGASNPFQIVYGGQKKQTPHPMIKKRFPLVLMLEPLHTCNLTCTGCGRIREYSTSLKDMMSLEDCLGAAQECNAPMVSICGGEPLVYPHIEALVEGVLGQGRIVYICTNAMFMRKKMREWILQNALSDTATLDKIEEDAKVAVRDSKTAAWNAYLMPIKNEIAEVCAIFDELSAESEKGSLILPIKNELPGC